MPYLSADLSIFEAIMVKLRTPGVLTEILPSAVLERSDTKPSGVTTYLVYGPVFETEKFYMATTGGNTVAQLDIFSPTDSKAKRLKQEVIDALKGYQLTMAGFDYGTPRFISRTIHEDESTPVVVHIILEVNWLISQSLT